MPRPQKLTSIFFERLKNLENLTITFGPNLITGIFGANGSGKSTVLHALACLYKPETDHGRANYKFSQFFTPTSVHGWANSKFTIFYDILQGNNMVSDHRIYRKDSRWHPYYDERIARDEYYIGIDSCVPDLEREHQTSRIQILHEDIADFRLVNKIKDALSYIMNRQYTDFFNFWNPRKKYRALTFGAVSYPSLYMGAGEQRLIRILEKLYTIPDYSLLLIDEIDLTLHTDALNRLIEKMHNECERRNIQVVFTSHREELIGNQRVNVRHLIPDVNGKTSICLDRTTPECIRRLTGVQPRPLEIAVEDELSEAIVKIVLRQNEVEGVSNVIRFGACENSYLYGTSLIIRGENLDNTLIVLDGDVDRTDDKKREKINKVITGSDAESQVRRTQLLGIIKQLNLPADTKPEVFIQNTFRGMPDSGDILIQEIKTHPPVGEHHDILNVPIINSGRLKAIALDQIAQFLSTSPVWTGYVQDIDDWVKARKRALNL